MDISQLIEKASTTDDVEPGASSRRNLEKPWTDEQEILLIGCASGGICRAAQVEIFAHRGYPRTEHSLASRIRYIRELYPNLTAGKGWNQPGVTWWMSNKADRRTVTEVLTPRDEERRVLEKVSESP